MKVASARKATVDHCTVLTVPLTPCYLFYTYIIKATNKAGSASQATEHTYVTGFCHFPQVSAQNSCLARFFHANSHEKFKQNRVENLSTFVRIFIRLRRKMEEFFRKMLFLSSTIHTHAQDQFTCNADHVQ